MAPQRITDEFVRHWKHLRDRTGDNPSAVMPSLAKHPELGVSLERLLEILDRVEDHRRFSKHRFIVQAHPEFRKALLDFMHRWPRIYAYGRDWLAVKDFAGHYRLLVEQTENHPSEVRQALDKNRDLAASIQRLHEIQKVITSNSRSAELFQAHPEFYEAFRDFEEHWSRAYNDYLNWLTEKLLDLDLSETTEINETLMDDRPEDDGRWSGDFDPDRDSIATVILSIEDHLRRDELDGWAEGLEWLQDTVGLNFEEIETRWKEFPVIIVPHHVSDKYSPDPAEPHGLFGYLNQVRLAYIIGADLAAVALCRATTELLIRQHYASDIPNARRSRKTKLSWLIEQAENREEFSFLKNFNLTTRVDQANDILHTSTDDIKHRDRARGLVRGWVRDLDEMITKAPTHGTQWIKSNR